MPRPRAVIVCYSKWCFSSVERVRLQGGVVAPMYENVGQGRQTPPSPPLAHPLLPLYSHQSLSTFFAKCQTLSFLAFCFCDKNRRQNLARNFSAPPSPVARVCQPSIQRMASQRTQNPTGRPPKGLKILPDGVPSAFPTFLERDEAAVHQTELGSLQEAGLVLA